jgi:hypothetical protein
MTIHSVPPEPEPFETFAEALILEIDIAMAISICGSSGNP